MPDAGGATFVESRGGVALLVYCLNCGHASDSHVYGLTMFYDLCFVDVRDGEHYHDEDNHVWCACKDFVPGEPLALMNEGRPA